MAGPDLFTRPNTLWGTCVIPSLAALPYFQASGLIWVIVGSLLLFWFLALIALEDEDWRSRTMRALSDPDFKQVYRAVTVPILARLWHRLCDPAPKNSSALATFRAALTARVYERAMLIAVVYPVLLPVVIWIATGWPGRMGEVEFLPGTKPWEVWPERMAVLGGIALSTGWFVAMSTAAGRRIRVILMAAVSQAILIWASTYASGYAGAGAIIAIFIAAFMLVAFGRSHVAGANAVLFLVTAGVSASFPVGGVVAFLFAVASSTAFGFSILIAVRLLGESNLQSAAIVLTSAVTGATLIVAALLAPWVGIPSELRSLFVFLCLFPLINAIFDALSYSVTLTLMRLGLRRWNPWLAGLADVAAALVLFLAVGVALTAAVAGMNRLAGVQILDLGALFAQVREAPGAHLWVFLMLFSTAVPTVLHLCLALLGAQALVPPFLRRFTCHLIATSPENPFAPVFAPAATGLVMALPFVMAGGLIWVLILVAKGVVLWSVASYGALLQEIAARIGAF